MTAIVQAGALLDQAGACHLQIPELIQFLVDGLIRFQRKCGPHACQHAGVDSVGLGACAAGFGDEFGKQPGWRARQFCTTLGQTEFPLEMAPEAPGDQKLVQHLERREFVFIDDLAVAEHFLRAFSGPVKMFNRPMHKDVLESHGFGQTDSPVLLRVPKSQMRSPQQRETCQVRMVIRKGAKLDHGAMLPQGISRDQHQKSPNFSGGLVKR